MNDTTQKIAVEAARDIIANLNGRSGIGIDDLPPEIRDEIANDFRAIIQSAIEKADLVWRETAEALLKEKESRAAQRSESAGQLYREVIPQPTTAENNFGNAIELLTEPNSIWVEPVATPATEGNK